MRRTAFLAALVAGLQTCLPALACSPGQGLGVSRIVEIDTKTGPLYGDMSSFPRQSSLLGPKEIVLTFDDGPVPWITRSILDTLDRFCTKATFFSVGRMAMLYPDTLREIMARGHTLGTHTWSHPLDLRQRPLGQAIDEIERGFAAVAAAAGQPIAPFFRFPGLADSGPMLAHLQSRGIATWTVDVVSNDSFIPSADRLTQETVAKVEARNGGILLFHDIKAVTAKALPGILAELQQRGFRVVHAIAKAPFQPDPKYIEPYASQIAARSRAAPGRPPLAFFAAMPTADLAARTGAPVIAVQAHSTRSVPAPADATYRQGEWSVTVRRTRVAPADAFVVQP
jgi:peptidoglycan/xylan/chitin deacetylase (PgdA/CDA1 family)